MATPMGSVAAQSPGFFQTVGDGAVHYGTKALDGTKYCVNYVLTGMVKVKDAAMPYFANAKNFVVTNSKAILVGVVVGAIALALAQKVMAHFSAVTAGTTTAATTTAATTTAATTTAATTTAATTTAATTTAATTTAATTTTATTTV